jgi:hypothetical protein
VVSAPAVYAIPKQEEPIESQSFVDEIPNKPETLKIESAGKPLAFGSLMETVTEATDDAAFVAPPNPDLADRDWNAGEEEADEEEEEDSASSTWRRDGGSEELAADPAVENAAEKAAARNKRRESWTPTREKTQDLLEEAAAPESFISAPPPAPVFSEVAPPQNSYPIPQSPRPEMVESKTGVESKTASNPEVASPVIATIRSPPRPKARSRTGKIPGSALRLARGKRKRKRLTNWQRHGTLRRSRLQSSLMSKVESLFWSSRQSWKRSSLRRH